MEGWYFDSSNGLMRWLLPCTVTASAAVALASVRSPRRLVAGPHSGGANEQPDETGVVPVPASAQKVEGRPAVPVAVGNGYSVRVGLQDGLQDLPRAPGAGHGRQVEGGPARVGRHGVRLGGVRLDPTERALPVLFPAQPEKGAARSRH
jgi:hypothetical protein